MSHATGEAVEEEGEILSSGAVLSDRYEILEHVNSGGMADVYRARDRESDRRVAIKVPFDGVDDRLRFARESELLLRIKHPNVMPVLAAFPKNTPPFYVMPLATARLDERRAYLATDRDEALRVFALICSGVGAIHLETDAHRDISAGNILFVDGTPVVSDLGLAKISAPRSRLTTVGANFGTPLYRAPELDGNPAKASVRSDVFALGKVLQEMLTGVEPVCLNPGTLERSLERVIRKATNGDATRRYATPIDIVKAIDGRDISPQERVLSALRSLNREGDGTGLAVTTFGRLHASTDLDIAEAREALVGLRQTGEVTELIVEDSHPGYDTAVAARLTSTLLPPGTASKRGASSGTAVESIRSPEVQVSAAQQCLQEVNANPLPASRTLDYIPNSVPARLHERTELLSALRPLGAETALLEMQIGLRTMTPRRLEEGLVWVHDEPERPWRSFRVALAFDGSVVIQLALAEANPEVSGNVVLLEWTAWFVTCCVFAASRLHVSSAQPRSARVIMGLHGVLGRNHSYASPGTAFRSRPFEGDRVVVSTPIDPAQVDESLPEVVSKFAEAMSYWSGDFDVHESLLKRVVLESLERLNAVATGARS